MSIQPYAWKKLVVTKNGQFLTNDLRRHMWGIHGPLHEGLTDDCLTDDIEKAHKFLMPSCALRAKFRLMDLGVSEDEIDCATV